MLSIPKPLNLAHQTSLLPAVLIAPRTLTPQQWMLLTEKVHMAISLDPPSREYLTACFSMTLLLLTFLLWQGGVAGKHIGTDSLLLQRLGLLAA